MPEKTDQTNELSEQMRPVAWGRFERAMLVAIAVVAALNLIVGILALGPDLWGS